MAWWKSQYWRQTTLELLGVAMILEGCKSGMVRTLHKLKGSREGGGGEGGGRDGGRLQMYLIHKVQLNT